MSLLRKLFRSKEVQVPVSQAVAVDKPTEKLLDAQALIPLAGLDEPRAVIELIKANEHETAFAKLNLLKAAREKTRHVDYLRAHLFIRKQQPIAALEALKEELRYFPDNALASRALASIPKNAPPSKIDDPEFHGLFAVIRPYTMVGEDRLYSLFKLAREACAKDLPGNFVECGVAAGGSSALLAAVIKKYSKRPRKIFSFDTFEGMPPASDKDSHLGTPAAATGWGEGTCAAPIDSLMEAAAKLEAKEFVQPVQGLFAETLPRMKNEIGQIAFLHVDGDWYSSTMDVLNNLYDQVIPGAPIQVDDYGFWEGCKKAMDEFQQARGVQFQLNKIDFTGVWFYKPQ